MGVQMPEHTQHDVSMGRLPYERYERIGQLFRTLASPARIAIVNLLAGDDSSIPDLMLATGLTQSILSQHLRTLRGARLVQRVRTGRTFIYRLVDPNAARIVQAAIAHAALKRPREDLARPAQTKSAPATTPAACPIPATATATGG
jgi:ArsR family transcriptional regulator, zinc-responsive transcriptional repressor